MRDMAALFTGAGPTQRRPTREIVKCEVPGSFICRSIQEFMELVEVEHHYSYGLVDSWSRKNAVRTLIKSDQFFLVHFRRTWFWGPGS